MFFVFVQFGDSFNFQGLPVHLNPGKPFFFQFFEELFMSSFLAGDKRGQNHNLCLFRQGHDLIHNLIQRL